MTGLIRLHAYEPCVITTEEYEEIRRNLEYRILMGDTHPGDRIIAKLLAENEFRYHECKEQNK